MCGLTTCALAIHNGQTVSGSLGSAASPKTPTLEQTGQMEKIDFELLNQLIPENYRLRKLYDEHRALETRISEIERSRAQFSVAEIEWQRLKKRKLQGMDEIMSILADYRTDLAQAANL